MEEDPGRARRMLLNLTGYLRGSLRRTRSGATTLGEELDLVRAYLEIQEVRMGERLAFDIRCPEPLRDRPLPPLLLQPLVENALRHGLEPRVEGGRVTVSAVRAGDALVLEVQDDGAGIDLHRPPGVGLANVRERVRAISGGAGSLTLQPVVPSGLCARIVIPWDMPGPAATGAGAAGGDAAGVTTGGRA
ncbi:MAG: histidine kinase [Anaeromyxobacter sp.]